MLPHTFAYLSVRKRWADFHVVPHYETKCKPSVAVQLSVTFKGKKKGRKWTYAIVPCGRLEVHLCTFLWTRFIWLRHLSILENIWENLPCILCFKHQGELACSPSKEPLAQKLPHQSNYTSTRQTALCSALHVKMGMFIEPFANSNRLYPHKSKYKNILIYLKHVSAFFLFLIKKKCYGRNGRFKPKSD